MARREGSHERSTFNLWTRLAAGCCPNELLEEAPRHSRRLRELLTGSAEGTPSSLEELVRMMIDQGAIETGEPWKVQRRTPPCDPGASTLTGVLQARLVGLPRRRSAHCSKPASVGFAVFWDQALAAIEAQRRATAALVQT